MPLFGPAIGAITGALIGKLTDIGIDDASIRDAGQSEVLQTPVSAVRQVRRRVASGGCLEEETAPPAAAPAAS